MKEVPQGVGRLPGELGSVTALHWVSLMKARKEHITQCFFWEPASLQWLKSIKTVGKGPSGGREKSPLQHSVCFPLSPSPSEVKLRGSPGRAAPLEELLRVSRQPGRFPFAACLRSAPSAKEMKACLGIWIPPGKKLHWTSASLCMSGKGMDFTGGEC